MEYFIRHKKGKEEGPFPESILRRMAQDQKITTDTEIRNGLMKTWTPATKHTSVKDIIKLFADEKADTLSHRLGENVSAQRKAQGIKNLTTTSLSIKPPSVTYRLGSFILDSFILLAFFSIVFAVSALTLGSEGLSEAVRNNLSVIILTLFIIPFLYLSLFVGLRGQTIGQKFFGIILIKRGTLGEPVLMGRAFAFSFFYTLFLPIDWLFLYFINGSLHEIFSQTAVVNIQLGS